MSDGVPENDWLCKTCSQPFFGFWSSDWARCHCRLCGGSFCKNHCSTFLPLSGLESCDDDKLHRVCDDCYELTYRTSVALHRISPTSQLFGDEIEETRKIELKEGEKSLPEFGVGERGKKQSSPGARSATDFKYWRFFPNLAESAPVGGKGGEGGARCGVSLPATLLLRP